jgi:tRNA A37 threonylcarbamoyladenosine biosynthesis protein TsaE
LPEQKNKQAQQKITIMTEYLALQQKKFMFYDVYRIACQEALDNFDCENNASKNIQRVFRGTRSREKISKKK